MACIIAKVKNPNSKQGRIRTGESQRKNEKKSGRRLDKKNGIGQQQRIPSLNGQDQSQKFLFPMTYCEPCFKLEVSKYEIVI